MHSVLVTTSASGKFKVVTDIGLEMVSKIEKFKSAHSEQKKEMIKDLIDNRDDSTKSAILMALSNQGLLHKFDFQGINFLELANFSGLDLTGAILNKLELANADFIKTNLTDAQLEGIQIRCGDFRGATMLRTNLSQSYLLTVEMREINKGYDGDTEVNLSGSRIFQSDLNDSNLRKSNFTNTKLHALGWTRTDVSESDFAGAEHFNNYMSEAIRSNVKNLRWSGSQ